MNAIRSPETRARMSISAKAAAQAKRDAAPPRREGPRRLPLTRGDCLDGPRPCPYIECRHHMLADLPDDDMVDGHTCSLDSAVLGPMILEDVARVLGVTRERIRQIEDKAIKRLLPVMRKNGLTRDDACGFAHARNVHDEEAIDAGHDCDADQSRRWRTTAKQKAGK